MLEPSRSTAQDSVARQGLGFRVYGLGLRVWGLGFREESCSNQHLRRSTANPKLLYTPELAPKPLYRSLQAIDLNSDGTMDLLMLDGWAWRIFLSQPDGQLLESRARFRNSGTKQGFGVLAALGV